ncbi:MULTISPECIES: phage tail assembly protein [Leptolyngbya]|uniref:Phage tail assembly protein n=1 Tax=Leptolyngbya boryana CZ1 TaxID=3060204 RepID=A0AA97AKQ0_LEPBY|nr:MULTISPECIES: phage tail assembly protein [Leptolyngbya]MBN8562713.1 phage tail assembly protein [Leptolyngbya sp. UWPOB_LEPTO1]MCY6490783.1 phage tail assembly protein [Leptolyngbya sp. GGD]WNZ43448.1 phage tail assembly protein [Leptolyngbya boryana CZ1]
MDAIEFEFTLPRGLVGTDGAVHRQGIMRLATAKDEIAVQRDRRTQESTAYGLLIMLSRVIKQLGSLSTLTPENLENLFSRDLAYLREFFNRINQQGNAHIPAQCPTCSTAFQVELELAGEP